MLDFNNNFNIRYQILLAGPWTNRSRLYVSHVSVGTLLVAQPRVVCPRSVGLDDDAWRYRWDYECTRVFRFGSDTLFENIWFAYSCTPVGGTRRPSAAGKWQRNWAIRTSCVMYTNPAEELLLNNVSTNTERISLATVAGETTNHRYPHRYKN